MHRPWLSRWNATALAAACALSCCGPQASAGAAPLPVKFQLDWYPSAEHGGHFEALALGYYREAGLAVTIASGGPSAYALQSVAMGRTEFAMGRSDDVIVAVSHGIPLVIVGVQMQHDPQAVMVHADSPVRSFRDLAGRTVMVSLGAHWVDFVQHHFGITFRIVPTDYGLARFMADPTFIQQCFVSNEPYFARLNGAKVRTLLVADAGYDCYRVIYTSRSFAARNPGLVRAFLTATDRGWMQYLHGDPGPAFDLIAARNPGQTRELMAYSLAALQRWRLVEGDPARGERLGQMTRPRLQRMVAQLVEMGALAAPLPLEEFADFSFQPVTADTGR